MFQHTPGETLCGSFVNLYKELNALIPQEINFEIYQDRLTFCLYEYHSWSEWTFHWLPISFIDNLTGRLKRIAITFIHEFAKNQRHELSARMGRFGMDIGVDDRICIGSESG